MDALYAWGRIYQSDTISSIGNPVLVSDTNSSNLQPRMQAGIGACGFHNTYSDWIIGVLNEVEDYGWELLDQDWPKTLFSYMEVDTLNT
jgi:hypothetical protein